VEIDRDPVVATWQAAALAPLGPADAQQVLELDDPRQRMELVRSLLGEEADVLAHRVAAG
jgi:Lon protease-like protein